MSLNLWTRIYEYILEVKYDVYKIVIKTNVFTKVIIYFYINYRINSHIKYYFSKIIFLIKKLFNMYIKYNIL